MRSLTRLALLALLGLGACAIHPGRVHQVRFASDAETVLASTQAGVVRGVEGAGVRAFLGVPYARPPVGELRWRAPQPVEPWKGRRDATRIGSDCTQAVGRKAILGGGGGIVVGSEDCLYLNIYAPAGARDTQMPVMVYVPGGAFTVGSAANYDPSRLAAEQGRVVVAINYRLGAIGWLVDGAEHEGEEPEQGTARDGLARQLGRLLGLLLGAVGRLAVLLLVLLDLTLGLIDRDVLRLGQGVGRAGLGLLLLRRVTREQRLDRRHGLLLAVAEGHQGLEDVGLRIVGQRRIKLTEAQAKKFYEVHAERPFYGELVGQMIAEPVVVQVLEAEGAVAKYREVMGATNPNDAAEGTIRKQFALSIGENSVHGSDSQDNAKIEIAQFFTEDQIVG